MSRESAVPEWQPDLEPYEKPSRPPAEIVEFPVVVRATRDTVTTPRPRRAPARVGLSPALAGIIGAATAVGLGILIIAVPVALIWVFITGDGLVAGLRAGVTMWLGAQSVPITISGIGVSLLPWGFGLVLLLVISAVAKWTARMSGLTAVHKRQVMGLSVVAAVVYAGLAAALCSLATSGAALPARAAGAGVLVVIVWWWSAAGRTGVRQEVLANLPDHVRSGLRAAMTALGLLAGAAAVLLMVSLVVHRSEFISMLTAPGDALGIAALCLLMIGYLPVALGWSVAYLLGPGFTVSAGVVVSPLSQSAADVTLPAIPWLAGVPTGGGVLTMLVLIPVGLITGVVLARRLRSIERWQSRAVGIGVAAVTTGVIVGLACRLSAGAVGTDRLASIGPNSIASALVAILVVALGATLVEVARYVRRRFRED